MFKKITDDDIIVVGKWIQIQMDCLLINLVMIFAVEGVDLPFIFSSFIVDFFHP